MGRRGRDSIRLASISAVNYMKKMRAHIDLLSGGDF